MYTVYKYYTAFLDHLYAINITMLLLASSVILLAIYISLDMAKCFGIACNLATAIWYKWDYKSKAHNHSYT